LLKFNFAASDFILIEDLCWADCSTFIIC